MHHDDKHLADITDKTMRRLINEAVVMPSKYMETFTEEEQKSLRGTPGQRTDDGTASEIDLLRSQLFSDDITRARNRLWLYKQKLNERQGFVDEGYLVSLRIPDYETIVSEYDSIIGNRVLTLACNYVIDYMTMHHIPVEVVRYTDGHFLLFLHGMEENEVEELLGRSNTAAESSGSHSMRLRSGTS
ncbi:MAG: hypothetical protein P8Y51_10450 [Campylobacterales bacterium]